jgi:hypothetical protein
VTLPPEAQPHEEAYLEMKDQMAVLEKRRQELVQKRNDLDRKLRANRIHTPERARLVAESKALQRKFRELKRARRPLRTTMKYANVLPYCIVFYYIAQKRLDDVLFKELDQETKKTMGRSVERFALNYFAVKSRSTKPE